MTKHLDEIERDFAKFKSLNTLPSRELQERTKLRVKSLLNPSLSVTVTKFFLFQAVGSLVTLTFCPQFGLSLTGSLGFMPYLMQIHPAVCFFFCGLSWMAIGQGLNYFFLTIDEQRVVGNSRWGIAFASIALSLLFFGCLGRIQIDGWLAIWALGALLVTLVFNAIAMRRLRRLGILGKPKLVV
ncbi:MAG: hypothetical protein HYZ71_12555 [Deltaproteobacteria bacterium]|nr:hypothetical protein [Deltaproteobacteria bacterium]